MKVVTGWAADPRTMVRFEQIVKLTQRTEVVRELLQVPEDQESLLRAQIRATLEKNEIEYVPPRGRPPETTNPKKYGRRERYQLAVLLGLQMSGCDDGALISQDRRIDPMEALDRLIYSYQRYLQLFAVNTKTAEISFEFFLKCWRSIQVGEADLETCTNCGGTFGNFRIAQVDHQCPLCIHLRLAELPQGSFTGRAQQVEISLHRAGREQSGVAAMR
jgi:hypothetical protein